MCYKFSTLSCLGSFRGMHDCLVPITSWIGNVFDSIRKTDKIPCRVRAKDMRNLLLVLPFLLHNLLVIHLDYLLYLLYLCILLSFRILTALSLLRILRLHRKFQDLYLVTLQRGWMTVTQKLSTSAACSRKVFMSSLSLQYWVGWHWCLSATLAPSHSPCARRHATFLAHPATRRWTQETAIDGGTSTVLP